MHQYVIVMLALALGVGCLEPNDQQVAGSLDPSCDDGSRNNNETDVDCGGSCAPCGVAKDCEVAEDCESLSCDGECIAATCSDDILNGSEVEVDCGGPACPVCETGTFGDVRVDARDMAADSADLGVPDLAMRDVGEDAGEDAGADMHVVTCGDGIVEGDEECDDQNDDDDDDCIDCVAATCGDGFVQAGIETCDDQNAIDTDACVGCEPATCGDGFVQLGVESCDTAGETAGCDADCTLVVCGDGVVNVAASEQCEGVSGCDANCQWEPLTYLVTTKAGLFGLGSDCSTTDTFPHTCSINQPYGFSWIDSTPYQPSAVKVEFSTGNYCSTSRLKDTTLNGAGSGQFVLADAPCACESPNPPLNDWDLFNVQSYLPGATNTFAMASQNACEGIALASGQFYARITVTP